MTSTQMHAYFDLLVDKQGGLYFSDNNKDLFLNMAQIEYLKQMLPSNEGGRVNFEFDHIQLSNVSTLLYEIGGTNMNASGEILRSAVQTLLNTASSSTEPFVFVANVSVAGRSCKFTKHNDWYEYSGNIFKIGSTNEPRYRELGTKFVLYPVSTTAAVKFTVIKQPKDIVLSSVDCEFPAHTHKKIVEIAVDLATIAIRDGELKQLNGDN